MDNLGLYVSIPFCRAKCSFCNFASNAFAPGRLPLYVDRLCREITSARTHAARLHACLPETVDTLYFGGGTPSLLSPEEVRRIFASLRDHFTFAADPEITVECAPGQLSDATLEELVRQGVNRLSFGVQSFIDRESAAIGRLHTAEACLHELERIRSAGLPNLSLDLIAGLPHQTETSWRTSIAQAIACAAPHVSVYMLEVDEDSRLGREILADGSRYGASTVPSDDECASFYEIACDLLGSAGIAQYEISNFARPGFASRHNAKYWQRRPYLGFGLDAHSMLRTRTACVRFANTGDLDAYLAPFERSPDTSLQLLSPSPPAPDFLTPDQAFEEALFLGLRMNGGISLTALRREFGDREARLQPVLAEAVADGLVVREGPHVRLTARGRVLSNELFSRLLLPVAA